MPEAEIRVVPLQIHDLRTDDVVAVELLSEVNGLGLDELGLMLCLQHGDREYLDLDLRCLTSSAEVARDQEGPCRLHVTICPRTLTAIPTQRILDQLAAAGGASRFCIEISERGLIGFPRDLLDAIKDLRAAGARLCLKDVGSGRGAMESVFLLRPDMVKLARDVVREVASNAGPVDEQLVRLVEGLLALDVDVTAVGVEDRKEIPALRRLGVGLGQGPLWNHQAG